GVAAGQLRPLAGRGVGVAVRVVALGPGRCGAVTGEPPGLSRRTLGFRKTAGINPAARNCHLPIGEGTMAPREAVEARPRGTVEILDDAWRLAFADAPLLLSLSALFILPALVCL